jgi:hypothetical protein
MRAQAASGSITEPELAEQFRIVKPSLAEIVQRLGMTVQLVLVERSRIGKQGIAGGNLGANSSGAGAAGAGGRALVSS